MFSSLKKLIFSLLSFLAYVKMERQPSIVATMNMNLSGKISNDVRAASNSKMYASLRLS